MEPMPLHVRAERGVLPAHQYMDRATAEWLVSQQARKYPRSDNPSLSIFSTAGFTKDILTELIPSNNIFLDSRLAEGIHGRRHSLRVGMFAHLVHEITGVSLRLLKIAATYHDTQRLHDQDDPGHGTRAAIYVNDNIRDISGGDISQRDLDALDAMIRYHEVEYTQIPQATLSEFGTEIDAFKAADALDRARLPHLRWWPRPERIRLLDAHAYVPDATWFTTRHEHACVHGGELVQAALLAARAW